MCTVCAQMLRSVSSVTAFKVPQWSFLECARVIFCHMLRYTCAYYERPDMTLDEAQEVPFKLGKSDGLRNEQHNIEHVHIVLI